jgi:NAD+ diphosphatase
MYSCLAGFAEPGETLEDTVRREIMEEAGIKVGPVAYFASQPWPFPASLMIGCIAEALSTAITIDKEEIEDARWFTKDEARMMLARSHPGGLSCPPPLAIAHLLISAWVTGET